MAALTSPARRPRRPKTSASSLTVCALFRLHPVSLTLIISLLWVDYESIAYRRRDHERTAMLMKVIGSVPGYAALLESAKEQASTLAAIPPGAAITAPPSCPLSSR